MKSPKDNRVFNMCHEIDFPICRVFHKKYLYEMIIEEKNTLPHISKWEDPFEGFLFKHEAFGDSFEHYYGQCWSCYEEEETDATWHIYSPDKHGILVKSTFHKLWNSFYDIKCKYSMINCAIGKVKYLDKEAIIRELEDTPVSERLEDNGAGLIESLLIKRMEFEHEKEIRIIFDGYAKPDLIKNGLMSYPIKPNNLIDEIIADPRMPDSSFEPLREYFEKKNFILKKSELYQLPELKLTF